MEKKIKMITLVAGKNTFTECKEQKEKMHKIMQRLSEVLEKAKEVIVLTSDTKAPHFHILAQEEEADNLKLEIWPGTVKIHSINEYQARWMQNHDHERIVVYPREVRKVEDYYKKELEETAAEYFERRKREIYARADYKKETLEDMEKLKKILNGVLNNSDRPYKTTTADELVEDLNKFFDERGINLPTVVRTVFVYVCELKCL